MKIERLNDNQIRCTLNKQDLTDRQIRLGDLAYGGERARNLFRDMMQQAATEFGFEADDIPLMIEATPVPGEALVLVITKLEEPDELDTRFSRFTNEQDSSDSPQEDHTAYADEVLSCFEHINNLLRNATGSIHGVREGEDSADQGRDDLLQTDEAEQNTDVHIKLTRLYSFHSLDEIIQLCGLLVNFYHGTNSVYKDASTSTYYLMVDKSDHTPEEFNKICNMITEYGNPVPAVYATCDYMEEHFETIVKDCAVQILSVM